MSLKVTSQGMVAPNATKNMDVTTASRVVFIAYSYKDGTIQQVPTGRCYPIGSTVVKAGCTFTIYDGYNYDGFFLDFNGPLVEPSVPNLDPHHLCGECAVTA